MESAGVVPLNNSVFNPKMVNHAIDIYFYVNSPPCRALILLVKALGMKHNIKVVDITKGDHLKPEFVKMNPMHTIPTIDDGGFILWDSNVIMKYLVDQYAKDDSLYPKDPKRGAVVNQRLYYNACHLFPRFMEYAMPVLFHGSPPDAEKLKKLEESLELLDGFLDNQTWVAGQYLTIADFAVISVVATIEATGQIDLNKYGNLWGWYQRAKNAMSGYGYEEFNQAGADSFGGFFKMRLNH